jgi:acyl carrier protein
VELLDYASRCPPANSGENVRVRIQAELTEFIVTNFLFGDVERTPTENDQLVEDGIIDSTGILELVEFLESQFGINVSEEETVPENLGTIAALTSFVMEKQVTKVEA